MRGGGTARFELARLSPAVPVSLTLAHDAGFSTGQMVAAEVTRRILKANLCRTLCQTVRFPAILDKVGRQNS